MYKVATVGFGSMGSAWARHFLAHPAWELVGICDTDPARRREASALAPGARVTDDADDLIHDPDVDVVGLFAVVDPRPGQIRRALAAGRHVIAEKPIAADCDVEDALLDEIERSDRLVAVNLFNRNAWYHHAILEFIARGEIGRLGIVRVCHMTPGRLPGPGYAGEGPPFRDCGMHYVDVARWYAGSEYERWQAQGVRLWSEDDPWWVTSQGCFANGVVFEVTVGFVYGHAATELATRSYLEAIGTHGIARYHNDFGDVQVEMHGIHEAVRRTGPYGGKKLDVMIDLFARSLDAGRDLGLPAARDAVIASRVAQRMHDDAVAAGAPCVGTTADLEDVVRRKETSGSA